MAAAAAAALADVVQQLELTTGDSNSAGGGGGGVAAAALDVLEAFDGELPADCGAALASALGDCYATESDRATFHRVALQLLRVFTEAERGQRLVTDVEDDPAPLISAVWGWERPLNPLRDGWSDSTAVAAAMRVPVQELELLDAVTLAFGSFHSPATSYGAYRSTAAMGVGEMDFHVATLFNPELRSVRQALANDHERRCKVASLLLDALREPTQMRQYGTWTWSALYYAIWDTHGPDCAAQLSFHSGIFTVVFGHLKAVGTAEQWISRSTSLGRVDWAMMMSIGEVFDVGTEVVDAAKAEFVSCGLFDEMISAVAAVENRGVERLRNDTDVPVLLCVFKYLRFFCDEPRCVEKIRGVAGGIALCMEHSLGWMPAFGLSTGQTAALVAANTFGRDEEDSELPFTQKNVDDLLKQFREILLPTAWGRIASPTPERMVPLELTVSDKNKDLLLASEHNFVDYLLSGLMLDPEHPRSSLPDQTKIWLQQVHAECLVQLVGYPPGKEALLQNSAVVPAMESLATVSSEGSVGLSEEAREFARGVLLGLQGSGSGSSSGSGSGSEVACRHIMLSYQWDVQQTIARLNNSLKARGYSTWFDVDNMKGSVMDAMSEAVENSDVMLIGVSLRYKVSTTPLLGVLYRRLERPTCRGCV